MAKCINLSAHAVSACDSLDAHRTVLYLSILSCETSLKYLLECAGMPFKDVADLSYDLRALLDALCRCEVKEAIVGQSEPVWVPAAKICAIPIDFDGSKSSVGTILIQQKCSESNHSRHIRYGESIFDAPSNAFLQAAEKILDWTITHASKIRQVAQTESNSREDTSPNNPRRRDCFVAATKLCDALGGGVKVGDELKFDPSERAERGQDYWVGYKLTNYKGDKCGEISAGYVGYIGDVKLFSSIVIDGEVLDTESVSVEHIVQHDVDNNDQPRELKLLMIKLAERNIRKLNSLRGIGSS